MHAVTVEIMHAMWKPQKFKAIYLIATVYALTLTLPSASAVYWAFGDLLLSHSNAFALLPKSPFRDMAVILMLIHQFITFGFACTPLYFVWEKAIGMHECLEIARGGADMVLGHHLPVFRAHQLHRRVASCQLHRLCHPGFGSHFHLQIICCPRECSGAASKVLWKMGWDIYHQYICGHMGFNSWFWVRRMG
ncbi:auxin transporter-like protein 5 [Primulina eburnea]|uniref:auxin transporter-like protein 5 n=1 Tax=Primulina eburnea TaxID=1245227 RepID=UPI003C6C8960